MGASSKSKLRPKKISMMPCNKNMRSIPFTERRACFGFGLEPIVEREIQRRFWKLEPWTGTSDRRFQNWSLPLKRGAQPRAGNAPNMTNNWPECAIWSACRRFYLWQDFVELTGSSKVPRFLQDCKDENGVGSQSRLGQTVNHSRTFFFGIMGSIGRNSAPTNGWTSKMPGLPRNAPKDTS